MAGTGDHESGFLGSNNISGFNYVVGCLVGIVILISTITLVSHFCNRTTTNPTQRRPSHDPVVDVGLEEATIQSYPMLLYSEASSNDPCCSVCLADYKGTDRVRLLPDCGHAFHRRCIDPWLRMNPTCPVCRASPLSTHLATTRD